MASEAQLRANAKWDRENTDKITIKLNRSKDPSKAEIQAAAARNQQSVNAFIIEAIRDKL